MMDRGDDTNWLRNGLKHIGIEPWFPSRKSCKKDIPHGKTRHKIKDMSAGLRGDGASPHGATAAQNGPFS
jgi:hypothetical protein